MTVHEFRAGMTFIVIKSGLGDAKVILREDYTKKDTLTRHHNIQGSETFQPEVNNFQSFFDSIETQIYPCISATKITK